MLKTVDSPDLFEPFRAAGVIGLQAYTDADAAVARIAAIYDKGVAILREAFARFTAGEPPERLGPIDAFYPFLGIRLDRAIAQPGRPALVRRPARSRRLRHHADPSGAVRATTTAASSALLLQHHRVPVVVGISDRRIPLPFVIEESTADLSHGPDRRAAVDLPDARPEPHRRRHRQRHLAAGAGRARAAGAVHRRARRLQPAAPPPLHRDPAASTSSASCC